MVYDARVFNVMIASPSDVTSERDIVRDAVYEWNIVHAERTECVLLPSHWESHATPEMGERPQAIINRQLLSEADLLVAVFWTRVGSPTGTAPSGTIEEIQEHIAAKKPVMIYFSSRPVVAASVDPEQYAALNEFKEQSKQQGLIEEYESLADFSAKFQRQLQQTVFRELCTDVEGRQAIDEQPLSSRVPDLPDDAIRLLNEAVEDQHGSVLTTRTFGGLQVQTRGIEFVDSGDPRSEAHWELMLDGLFDAGLLTGSRDGVGRVTADGYRVADALIGWWRRPGAPRFRLGLASSKGQAPWTFEATIEQYDGSDVGDFAADWSGTSVVGTTGDLKARGARKWQVPTATVDPRITTEGEPQVELSARFRWDGRPRTQTWRWRAADDFQTREVEEVRE